MAQLNENFMSAIAYRTIKDIENSSITQSEFCRLVGIQPSYVTFLKTKGTYFKVPEWVWYLFRDFNNKKFEINGYGQLDGHGYTIKEIKKDCKTRSKKENLDIAGKRSNVTPDDEKEIDFSKTTEGIIPLLSGMEIEKTKGGISERHILDLLREIVDLELKQTYYLRDQWVEIKSQIQKLDEQ